KRFNERRCPVFRSGRHPAWSEPKLIMRYRLSGLAFVAAAAAIFASPQNQGVPSGTIRGHLHPLAQSRYDRGKVSGLFAMSHVQMMFKPTSTQQSELNALLEDQQNPSSPDYHRWLTPEEFANRFGLSPADMNRTVAWLQDQGFTVDEVAPGSNWIAFSGFAH